MQPHGQQQRAESIHRIKGAVYDALAALPFELGGEAPEVFDDHPEYTADKKDPEQLVKVEPVGERTGARGRRLVRRGGRFGSLRFLFYERFGHKFGLLVVDMGGG